MFKWLLTPPQTKPSPCCYSFGMNNTFVFHWFETKTLICGHLYSTLLEKSTTDVIEEQNRAGLGKCLA